MQNLEKCLNQILNDGVAQNIIVKVGQNDKVICDIRKSLNNRKLTDTTLFDMASITKIVAVTSLALIAIDKGLISPEDSIAKYLDVPEDKKAITLKHVLTHSVCFHLAEGSLYSSGYGYDRIQDFMVTLPLAFPLGTKVIYNCFGFIFLARILEKVYGKKLEVLLDEYVVQPLNLENTCYLPDNKKDIVNANINDEDIGLVNDGNSRSLGGVCGNAGMFSCIKDMTKYVKMLLDKGYPLFSEKTFEQATKNYTRHLENESRGLGFLYVDDRYPQTGDLFPDGSFGHCGHTGQSFFIDPKTGLYVIILSDATVTTTKKYGYDKYEVVTQMRVDIHNAIKKDLE